MPIQATTTGTANATTAYHALGAAIAATNAILNPPPETVETLLPKLAALCRTMTDQLSNYAVSASNFDEDAFESVTRAERLLHDGRHVLGQLAKPQEGPDEDDQCPDCRCFRSEAEADEGWNPDEGCCFSCVDSVYALAERFGIHGDDLDTLREKLWEARERALKDEIEACLTFGK